MNEVINIQDGSQTEDLLKYILAEISDEDLDNMEIKRDYAPATGFASEPITIAVTIAASATIIVAVTRIIERWMENKRQDKARKMLLEAALVSDAAVNAMKELEIKHADVSIAYKLPKIKPEK